MGYLDGFFIGKKKIIQKFLCSYLKFKNNCDSYCFSVRTPLCDRAIKLLKSRFTAKKQFFSSSSSIQWSKKVNRQQYNHNYPQSLHIHRTIKMERNIDYKIHLINKRTLMNILQHGNIKKASSTNKSNKKLFYKKEEI